MWFRIVFIIGVATLATANLEETAESLSNFTDVEFYFNEHARVINGQTAQRRQLPWHAIIEIVNFNGFSRLCAGSLISSTFVLTESNAIRGSRNFEVILGAHFNTDRRVVIRSTRAIHHPKHKPGSGNFNIGLLELERAFTAFTKQIHPVQLAIANDNYEGRHTWISGFGSTSATQFPANQWSAVRVLTLDECRNTFPGVESNVWCTVGHDSYHSGPGVGDGGAPLVALERGQYVQIGVFAFSWRNDFVRPVGYVNVADPSIRQWIRSISRV